MGKKRILVVDDDEGIRVTIEMALDECDVTTAESAVDAVPLLAGQEFDAIICDLMMPEMTGPELYKSLAADSPHLGRFLFISGGSAPRAMTAFVDEGPWPILKKPFSIASLRESLAQILSADAPRPPGSE